MIKLYWLDAEWILIVPGRDQHSGDLLSRLMAARDEQGNALGDDVIYSQVGGFLFAGFEVSVQDEDEDDVHIYSTVNFNAQCTEWWGVGWGGGVEEKCSGLTDPLRDNIQRWAGERALTWIQMSISLLKT